MKKTVLTYGLIAGLIVSAWLQVGVVMGFENMDSDLGMFFGYTAMIIAFSFIFVAIRNYRKRNDDAISFGKAFKIGLYITLIASTLYVLSWLIDYYIFVPDFMETYSQHIIEKLKTEGATAAEIQAKKSEMDYFSKMYENPIMVILFTYMEILPVGLLLSLISAAILRKKSTDSILSS